MVYVHKNITMGFIENPKKYFSELLFKDIKPYLKYLNKFEIKLGGLEFDDDIPVKHIPIVGKFGATSLANMPMGYIICLLAMIAISNRQYVCFIAGLLGENALRMLCEIAKGTDFVHLYSETGKVPSILRVGIFKQELVYVDC